MRSAKAMVAACLGGCVCCTGNKGLSAAGRPEGCGVLRQRGHLCALLHVPPPSEAPVDPRCTLLWYFCVPTPCFQSRRPYCAIKTLTVLSMAVVTCIPGHPAVHKASTTYGTWPMCASRCAVYVEHILRCRGCGCSLRPASRRPFWSGLWPPVPISPRLTSKRCAGALLLSADLHAPIPGKLTWKLLQPSIRTKTGAC